MNRIFKSLVLITILTINISFAQISLAADDNIKILVNIPSRTLEVINNGKVENSYSIGVGKPNFPTPTGNYKVITKIINPNWENPYKPAGESKIKAGKSNPLGTRWIGFVRNKNGEYGMHGTNIPMSIGKYSSHGCIRMKIKDAESLYSKVVIGTEVYIRNYPYKVFIQNNKIIVKKYKNFYKTAVNKKESIEEQLELFNTGYSIDQKKIDALKSTSDIGNTFAVKDKPGFKYIYSDFMANFD